MVKDAMATNTEQQRVGPNPGLPTAKLVSRREVSEDLIVIKLEPQDGPLKFKPSQYCTLGLNGIERAYSIASAPQEPLLEIFVELVPGGELTPLMFRMKIGDSMSIRPRAKGIFTMDQKVHHHYQLATVTGVAPFISVIRDYFYSGGQGHQFYLLLGASYADELTYDEELYNLAAEYPGVVHFVPTVSRPKEERNAAWEGAKGRVNQIAEEYLTKFDLPLDDTMIYACGHPGMIEDVKEKFLPQDWKFKEERFWKQ